MKLNIILTLFLLLIISSCSKMEKGYPKPIEPQYLTTREDLLNKIEENDSISMGFGQKTTENLLEKKTTRKLVFYIQSNLEKNQISEKYLQERNKKIRRSAIKEITNVGEYDSIESIYATKNGEEIKSAIIIDKLKK